MFLIQRQISHLSYKIQSPKNVAAFTPVITSLQNTHVRLLRAAQSKKGAASRVRAGVDGLVAVEGHRAALDALSRMGLRPQMIMATEDALRRPLGKELAHSLKQYFCEEILPLIEDTKTQKTLCSNYDDCVKVVSERVMRAVSETSSPPGIISLFQRPNATCLPPCSTLLLLCDSIQDPGNLGTLIRTAHALGADAVVAVGTTDPWSSKCVRSSAGAILRIPVVTIASFEEVQLLIHNQSLAVYIAHASDCKSSSPPTPYFEVDLTIPCVVIVGSEATGVSAKALALDGASVISVPMVPQAESLNVAVAGAVLLGEAARQRCMQSS